MDALISGRRMIEQWEISSFNRSLSRSFKALPSIQTALSQSEQKYPFDNDVQPWDAVFSKDKTKRSYSKMNSRFQY